jgi:hypothetical protein
MPTRFRLGIRIGLPAVFLIFVLILLGISLMKKPRLPRPMPRPDIANGVKEMPEFPPETVVEFQIVELKPSQRDGKTPMRVWDATYPSEFGAAHFGIAMELREVKPDEHVASTDGVLIAREDSRPDGLLSALASAHHASRSSRSLEAVGRSSKPRVREVPFQTAIFGTALTRGHGNRMLAGEFTSDTPGPWILVKIWLPAEGADIYVALNSSAGKGLFITRYYENWPDLEPFLESVL